LFHYLSRRPKASDINIDPSKSWFINSKHHSNLLLNPVITAAGAMIINDKNKLKTVTIYNAHINDQTQQRI
jgi:hypothetical protein